LQRDQVVHDLDLVIKPGEIVALLGANGAGKSTTLLTLAGVLRPIAGAVTLNGESAGGSLQRRARAGLGFLKESTSVFPTLSVAQNLSLGRVPIEKVFEIAPELRGLKRRRGGLLSGGEQRILSMARALAAGPRCSSSTNIARPRSESRPPPRASSGLRSGTAVLLVGNTREGRGGGRLRVLRRGRIALMRRPTKCVPGRRPA
jgi:branched-chain amino acid transport system ATP-binding protein